MYGKSSYYNDVANKTAPVANSTQTLMSEFRALCYCYSML